MLTEEPITELLERARRGDEEARARLWNVLLPVLRQRARQELAGNNVAGFVSTSDILQGAVEQLLGHEAKGFNNRRHLMGYAVTAMRHIIIDLARKHKPGERHLVPVDEELGLKIDDDVSWPEVGELLDQLAVRNADAARAVELRAFGGFTNEEIAKELECSLSTVKRHLLLARAFIMGRLQLRADDHQK
jgi:RNA polymerase sigma factor (TIGR02999 family)